LGADVRFDVRVVGDGSHREMLDQVLAAFSIQPDHDLNVITPGHTLSQCTSKIIAACNQSWIRNDRTASSCKAIPPRHSAEPLAAFYRSIPVAHVRRIAHGTSVSLFPERMNRVLTGRLASLHFAATDAAAENLRARASIRRMFSVTGNTGIDAVMFVSESLPPVVERANEKQFWVTPRRRVLGAGFASICRALRRRGTFDWKIFIAVHRSAGQGVVENGWAV